MKWLTKIRQLREANTQAAEASKVILAQAKRHGNDADQKLMVALDKLEHATAQARRLNEADQRNHYSESLTHSFRERPAQ